MRQFADIRKHFGVCLILILMLSGCYTDKSNRNIEFAPNMYNSIPLEPYSQTVLDEDSGLVNVFKGATEGNAFSNGLSAQKAPEGTVPREDSWYSEEAYMPYQLPDNEEAYVASDSLTSPISDPAYNTSGLNCTQASFDRGKRLYQVYCEVCHGANGMGKGSLVQQGALIEGSVPAYSARPYLTPGRIYHVITYGRNNMGSYASQLTPKQRWEVTCYVQGFLAPAEEQEQQ